MPPDPTTFPPMTASQVKAVMRERGWRMLDLAARWNLSPAWMSKLINHPGVRTPIYEDAFRGLPERESVEVRRQARHKRKPRPKGWTLTQMFPRGRLFEALDSSLVDEGTRLIVVAVELGSPASILFAVAGDDGRADPEAGDPFPLSIEQATVHLADLCLDAPG